MTATNAEGASTAIVSVIVGETLTISEFLAVNGAGLLDEDGETSDWIEIHNTTGATINTDGWYLTDDASLLTRWRLPAFNLASGGYLVVFASGKDRALAGNQMHANLLHHQRQHPDCHGGHALHRADQHRLDDPAARDRI